MHTPTVHNAQLIKVAGVNTLDVMIDLGFGVSIKKRVKIVGAENPLSALHRKDANYALIILCAGKNKRLKLRTTAVTREGYATIHCQVFTQVANPPEDMVEVIDNTAWMDLGRYLTMVREIAYDPSYVKKHAHGVRS